MDNLACPKKKHACGHAQSGKKEKLQMDQIGRRPYHVCNTVLRTSCVKRRKTNNNRQRIQQVLHHGALTDIDWLMSQKMKHTVDMTT